MSVKNIIGEKFGKLIVVNREKNDTRRSSVWLCKCECGKEKIATGYGLLHGYTKSCGCLDAIDLTNQSFGKLVVVKLLSKTDKICHDRYWLCECECGKLTKVRQSHLVNKKIKSCGCEQFQIGCKHPCWTGYGEFSGTFFTTIVHGAKIRDLEFSITKEYIWDLFLKQNRKCALTGLELWFSKFSGGNDGNASLDRIDSSKGYVEENVWWVHKDINRMKLEFPLEKLYEYCKLICINKKLL